MILILFTSACSLQPAPGAPTPQPPTRIPATATPPATVTVEAPIAPTPTNQAVGGNGQIANPASKNCIDKGGKLDIRTDSSGGQFGVCVFPNGKECEEWALMRGQCSPEGSATPKTNSLTYTNAAYKFSLKFGPDWNLEENAPTGTKPLTLVLTHGNNSLTLQVKHASDAAVFAAEAPQGGDISQQGTLSVLGQETPLQVVKLEGRLKSAGLNVHTADVLFRFQLDNQADPEIATDVLDEAQQIITSLQLIP